MREADHRAKNMLSVVQAIANLSAFQGDTETFVKRFGERLVGLSECHDLLVQSKWASVDLEQLIRRHLDCYMIGRESRISIDGPTLRLAETAAKPISMALHGTRHQRQQIRGFFQRWRRTLGSLENCGKQS